MCVIIYIYIKLNIYIYISHDITTLSNLDHHQSLGWTSFHWRSLAHLVVFMCSSRPTPIGIVLESNNSADSFFTRLEFGVPLKLMRKPLPGEPCCVRYHRSPAPFHVGPFL